MVDYLASLRDNPSPFVVSYVITNLTLYFPWIGKRRESLGNKETMYYGVGLGLDDE